MELFGRKEKIKNQVLNLKSNQKQEWSKNNIIKPIAIGIAVLAMIVLIAFLTENTLIIILTAIVGQIGFIVYLAKILEKAQEIKLRNLKEKEAVEQRAKNLQQQLEKTKAQVKYPATSRILIPKITNFEDMKKYIERTLVLRFKKEEISAALISAGWPSKQVESAFYEIHQAKAGKTI